MNKKIAAKFERLQNSHAQLMTLLEKENPQTLETSPAPGKWSVTQVMYHLNKAESLSVLYVSKKRLGAAQLKPTGMVAQLKILIAWIGFNLPVKYPAAKVLGDMPPHVRYEEVKQQWLQTRKALASLLESLTDDEIRKPIFKQPFFGRWNIFQMLSFMQIHFNRHRKQMLRTIETVKKAAS
jgi:hypothetical protein